MTTLYGIKNCDSVKKATKWLDSRNVAYTFHDFRVDNIAENQVASWVDSVGWENVINKRSTSWKQLDSDSRERMDNVNAIAAVLKNPTLVKRPVLERGGNLVFGFKESIYTKLF